MTSQSTSKSAPTPTQQSKPDTLQTSEMLSPSEIEALRQHSKDATAYFQKAFKNPKGRLTPAEIESLKEDDAQAKQRIRAMLAKD